MNKAICVVGMHRTGTSAMMGILRILGVDIGDNLKHKDKWNPKGYLENPEFRIFQIKIAHYLSNIPEKILYKKLNLHKKEFKTLVAKYNRSPLWGYKANRSMLFPEIFHMIPNIHFIIMLRDPQNVYDSARLLYSLNKNNVFEQYLIRYYRFLYFLSRNDYPYIFVSYDELVDKTVFIMRKVSKFIGVELTNNHITEGRKWIEKGLRHHKSDEK